MTTNMSELGKRKYTKYKKIMSNLCIYQTYYKTGGSSSKELVHETSFNYGDTLLKQIDEDLRCSHRFLDNDILEFIKAYKIYLDLRIKGEIQL